MFKVKRAFDRGKEVNRRIKGSSRTITALRRRPNLRKSLLRIRSSLPVVVYLFIAFSKVLSRETIMFRIPANESSCHRNVLTSSSKETPTLFR